MTDDGTALITREAEMLEAWPRVTADGLRAAMRHGGEMWEG